MRELAVRAVDLAPGLEQPDDYGAFPGQQAVQPVPARRRVRQPAVVAAGRPVVEPGVIWAQRGARPPRGPAMLDGVTGQVGVSITGAIWP